MSHRTHVQHKVAMEMLVETWGHSQKPWRFKPGKKKKKRNPLDQRWASTETKAHGSNDYSVRWRLELVAEESMAG